MEDSKSVFDGVDSIISIRKSGSEGLDSLFEFKFSGVEESLVDGDLVEEVVSLFFLGSQVNLSLSLVSLSLSEFSLLLGSNGFDFSNESIVVVSRVFFTLSVISVGFLDGSFDLL